METYGLVADKKKCNLHKTPEGCQNSLRFKQQPLLFCKWMCWIFMLLFFPFFISFFFFLESDKKEESRFFSSTPTVPLGRNSMCLICLNWTAALGTSFFYEYISRKGRNFWINFCKCGFVVSSYCKQKWGTNVKALV